MPNDNNNGMARLIQKGSVQSSFNAYRMGPSEIEFCHSAEWVIYASGRQWSRNDLWGSQRIKTEGIGCMRLVKHKRVGFFLSVQ